MAPKWLENEDSNSMKNSIVNHITNVLKHYEGKIDTWDVVNEAIDDSSNGNGWKMRNSFLTKRFQISLIFLSKPLVKFLQKLNFSITIIILKVFGERVNRFTNLLLI
jgi:hypothetical protein